jgi:hypothetical protein
MPQFAAELDLNSSITASSGNVAAATATATIAAVANRTNYLSGFACTVGGATAASTVSVTVTGLVGGTMTYCMSAAAGVDVPSQPLVVNFPFPVPATGPNTAISVSMPSLGAGNAHAAVVAFGYQVATSIGG